MVECVIFDCDGTLVDSEYLCCLGLEINLKEYGLHISANKLALKFRGWKLSNIIQEIENEHKLQLKNNFVSSYRKLVDELFERNLTPCEGVVDALESIDLPKCVASSGPLEKIQKALDVSGLSKYFDRNLFSSYEIGSWKPEPDLFLYSAKQMGYKSNNCMVVEDSKLGISIVQGFTVQKLIQCLSFEMKSPLNKNKHNALSALGRVLRPRPCYWRYIYFRSR